jgi:hypothetical protein
MQTRKTIMKKEKSIAIVNKLEKTKEGTMIKTRNHIDLRFQ